MQARLSIDFAAIGRVVGIAGALAWALVIAMPAQASRLAEVRVGSHPGFTRVVLELDGPAGYRLGEPRGETSPELLLELDAESEAKAIASTRSAIVRSIQVEPSNRGSTVRIHLSDRDVHVTEMILSRPTRIVLDLRPMGETVAWAGKAKESAKSTTSKTPESSAPRAETAKAPEPEKPVAATETTQKAPSVVESASRKLEAAESAATAVAGAAAETAEKTLAEAKPSLAAAKESAAKAGQALDIAPDALEKEAALALGDAPEPEAPVEVEKSFDEGSDLAAAGGEETGEDPFLDIDGAEGAAPAPALRPDRVPGSAAEPAKPPTQTASRSDGGFFRSTTGIVAIAAALLVAIFAFFRMRRRSEEEALTSSFMEDEEFSLSGEDEEVEAEPEVGMPAAAAHEISEPDFAPSAEPEPIMPEPIEPEPTLEPISKSASVPPSADFSAASAAPVGTSVDKSDLQEIEQRLSQMESRIDDMMQARERLERQVAAQTEELRVQRAAIARTQRVVRSIARPEEGATEPVPRTPDRPGN